MRGRYCSARGQVGLENLLVYSIVVLTLIVGMVILWQSGLFKPPVGKRGYVGFSQLVPADWIVSKDNEVYLRLKNEASGDVRIPKYGVSILVGRVKCRLGPEEGDLDIPAGASRTLRLYCGDEPAINSEYDIGDYFEADAAINYTNLLTSRSHESIGRIYGVVEGYGAGNKVATTTSSTVVSQTTTTTCPQKTCVHGGVVDPTECDYPGCSYCRKSLECDVTGACGRTCTSGIQCRDPTGLQNSCPYCNLTTGKCEEPSNDCGKACIPGENHCQVNINCKYCFTRWDRAFCERRGTCGDVCPNLDNRDCRDPTDPTGNSCPYCNVTTAKCDQGDCGAHCTEDSTCQRGCEYCNLTTNTCEPGDCGKSCDAGNAFTECQLGCDKCQDGICTDLPVAVTINATNATGGKGVKVNETIFLNVSAQADKGVQRVMASKGVKTPSGDCEALIKDVNFKTITDPWTQAPPQIQWLTPYDCDNRLKECRHGWITNETEEDTFCYYAIAQEHIAFGKWSPIAYDKIDIGYIKVQLIFPRPR